MFRRMNAVLGASLIGLVVAAGSGGAAAEPGYDAVREVANCAKAAGKTFHASRQTCMDRFAWGTDQRTKCLDDTVREYFIAFEGCYHLAESYE
jgi:hypothetical protein